MPEIFFVVEDRTEVVAPYFHRAQAPIFNDNRSRRIPEEVCVRSMEDCSITLT